LAQNYLFSANFHLTLKANFSKFLLIFGKYLQSCPGGEVEHDGKICLEIFLKNAWKNAKIMVKVSWIF
jgi:hypothetical protein